MFSFKKAMLFGLVFLLACSKEIQPVVVLQLAFESALYDAKQVQLSGTILAEKGSEIGVVYAHQASPTTSDTKIILQNSDGNILKLVKNISLEMKSGDIYYFRLYVSTNGKITYSNEHEIFNSPHWLRLNDLSYEGFPLPEANLIIFQDSSFISGPYYKYHYLTFYTKTNETDRSAMKIWQYYLDYPANRYYQKNGVYQNPNGVWQENTEQALRNNPIFVRTSNLYTPYGDPNIESRRGIYGAGYYYFPQQQPPFTYAKDIPEEGSFFNFKGGDYPTITFAIRRHFPDYYVVSIGGNYEVWNVNPRLRNNETWRKVSAFPAKNSTKLLTCSIHDKGYVYGEDTHELFQYDPQKDAWTELKKAPFQNREKGIFFSFENVGYYGLGINPITGEGYKDIWQYNEASDSWTYLIDYPGGGSANVAVAGEFENVFLGLGYAIVPTTIHTPTFYPAHDVWEFKP